MRLADAVAAIPDFERWNHADKIKYFAWFLHRYRNVEYFSATDIRACFDELGIAAPASINPFVAVMEKRTPREVAKTTKGYKLEKWVSTALDARYGERDATISLPKRLVRLAADIENARDRAYVNEIFRCLRHRAYRAAMLLTQELSDSKAAKVKPVKRADAERAIENVLLKRTKR
jgi:hypothetical protein